MSNKIQIMELLFLCMILLHALAGCAKFQPVSTEPVKQSPERCEVVEEKFEKYFPLKVRRFPTEKEPYLEVLINKSMARKVKYRQKQHDVMVMEKKSGPLQNELETIANSVFKDPIRSLGGVVFGIPLALAGEALVPEDKRITWRKREKIPGSERVVEFYKNEPATRAGSNVHVLLEDCCESRTNKAGIAKFRISPEKFDDGLNVSITGSGGRSYTIKREKGIRKYKASWHETAKSISDSQTAIAILYRVGKFVIFGGNPATLVGHIILDCATGEILGYIIDFVATREEEYYRWTVVRTIKTN